MLIRRHAPRKFRSHPLCTLCRRWLLVRRFSRHQYLRRRTSTRTRIASQNTHCQHYQPRISCSTPARKGVHVSHRIKDGASRLSEELEESTRRTTAARADKSIPNGRHEVYLKHKEPPSRNIERTLLAEEREK